MLDRYDIALLNLLQSDALATADSLADKVALSPSAINRRLRRLRASGIIARSVAILSSELTDRGYAHRHVHSRSCHAKGLADRRRR